MAYTNSSLVTYTNISPNKTSPRTNSIDRITIHCVVGQWTAKQGCDYFANSSRKASCNYFVGKDGSVGLCVEEKDRSWCSSSAANDHRAITIETASDTTHPYAVTDTALETLVDLCEDICRRNRKKKLLWFGDKDTTLAYTPASDEMVMTVHRWFANKACPGDYLYNRHTQIANEVTARLQSGSGSEGEGTETTYSSYEKTIWDFLLDKLGNEYGVAGLMGNLYAESGLHPDIVQGDIPYSQESRDYTEMVDSGAVSEYDFVHNGPGGGGYGLAQWTFWSRKQGLYDMYKSGGYTSIGSIELALDYLWYELQRDFADVVEVLKSATTVRKASDKVLHDFENPANQSASVEQTRADYGIYYYNKYANGGTGGTYEPSIPGVDFPGLKSKPLSFLLLAIATDNIFE